MKFFLSHFVSLDLTSPVKHSNGHKADAPLRFHNNDKHNRHYIYRCQTTNLSRKVFFLLPLCVCLMPNSPKSTQIQLFAKLKQQFYEWPRVYGMSLDHRRKCGLIRPPGDYECGIPMKMLELDTIIDSNLLEFSCENSKVNIITRI